MVTRPPLVPDSTANDQFDTDPTRPSRRDLLRSAVSIVAATAAPARTPDAAEFPIPPSPSAKVAWQVFDAALADVVAQMREDQFLCISPKRSNRFVQFLDQGAHGIRMETTSNVYLTGSERLSAGAQRQLRAIGWHAPTSGADEGDGPSPTDIDGSSNFFRDAPRPVPYAVLARLTAATFHEVFGVRHPGQLEYDAGSIEDAEVALKFPALGLKRARRSS